MQAIYFIDDRSQLKDGRYPLKVRIYKDRSNYILIGLKIPLLPHQWDGKQIVHHDEAKVLNARLSNYRLKIGKEILDIDMLDVPISMADVRNRIEKAIGSKTETPSSFHGYFQAHIDNIKKPTTKSTFELALRNVIAYDSTDRGFQDINVKWLKGFEQYCFNKGLAVNSTSIYLRNIRTVFNNAIDDGVAQLNDYPFRRFKIKSEATPKRSLSIEQLKQFRDYPCEEHVQPHVDIFMLIFYLRGINIVDLVNLKKIENGRIEYRRAKTGRLYSVKVEPESLAIIEKYKGKKYLLNILDRYTNYHDYRHRLNDNLRKVGPYTTVKNDSKKKGRRTNSGPEKKEYTPLFPCISTYWARHSWATIAAGLDIPKETIAAGLGHEIGNSTTSIYIDFDQRKVDEASRKVLDAIK